MKRLIALTLLAAAVLAGCASLDERQRSWIFQPSDRSWWRGEEAAQGMQDVWIDFASSESGATWSRWVSGSAACERSGA